MKGLVRYGVVVAAASVLALAGALAARTASTDQTNIGVNPVTIGPGGTASGVLTGFQPGQQVTVNGHTFTADSSGNVNLGGLALLSTSPNLHISFTDPSGTPQSVDVPLTNATSGTPIQLTDILGLLLGQTIGTQGTSVSVGAPSTTTDQTTTTTTTTTTSGSRNGGSTGGGSSGGTSGTSGAGGGSASGPTNASGSVSSTTIAAGAITGGNRLVIAAPKFSKKRIGNRSPLKLSTTIHDLHGKLVVGALATVVSVPTGRIGSVRVQTSSKMGTVTFTITPTKRLKLVKGGRLTLYLRAYVKGHPAASTAAKRLVSIRLS